MYYILVTVIPLAHTNTLLYLAVALSGDLVTGVLESLVHLAVTGATHRVPVPGGGARGQRDRLAVPATLSLPTVAGVVLDVTRGTSALREVLTWVSRRADVDALRSNVTCVKKKMTYSLKYQQWGAASAMWYKHLCAICMVSLVSNQITELPRVEKYKNGKP